MQQGPDIINEDSLPHRALRRAVSAVIDEDEDVSIKLQRLRGRSKEDIIISLKGEISLSSFFAETKVIVRLEADSEISESARAYLRSVRIKQGMLAIPYPELFEAEFREYEALRGKILDCIASALAEK